jgi:sugar lactone lactonase YvrE
MTVKTSSTICCLLLWFSLGVVQCGRAEDFYVAKNLLPDGLTTMRTEGPVVGKDGKLYFCNMAAAGIVFSWNKEKSSNQGTIGVVHPDGGHEIFAILPKGMRGNGMRFHPNGNLLIADQLGGHVLELDMESKKVRVYFDFPDDAGSPNDLAIRRDGTLYVSFFGNGVWRITADKKGTKVAERFHNGIDLSHDGEFIRDIVLSGSKATNLAFGGPGGKTVYVTAKNIMAFLVEHPGRSFAMGSAEE